jgi:hypothetical protein
MGEKAARHEAGSESDGNALERLRHDLPLDRRGRSPPHGVERGLQFDEIAFDGLDRKVTLRVAIGGSRHVTPVRLIDEVADR